MQPILQLTDLQTGYRERTGLTVLSHSLNLRLEAGEVVMLMGPNGSGKSTLLHTLAGLLPPLSGEVRLRGRSLSTLSLGELAQEMSLVLTERLQTGGMTVGEVVALGRAPHTNFFGQLTAEDRDFVGWCIERCGLAPFVRRSFMSLSDGEKQRTLIARALAQATPLILLDEPTAHLDLSARLEVVLMLRELAEELAKSILISTHELELALSWADKLWLMDRGGDVVAGLPEDLALAGHLERVFGNDRLSYDLEQGRFFVRPETPHRIVLSGDPIVLPWTARALLRIGYATQATAEAGLPQLQSTSQGWRLSLPTGLEHRGANLQELLKTLAGL